MTFEAFAKIGVQKKILRFSKVENKYFSGNPYVLKVIVIGKSPL